MPRGRPKGGAGGGAKAAQKPKQNPTEDLKKNKYAWLFDDKDENVPDDLWDGKVISEKEHDLRPPSLSSNSTTTKTIGEGDVATGCKLWRDLKETSLELGWLSKKGVKDVYVSRKLNGISGILIIFAARSEKVLKDLSTPAQQKELKYVDIGLALDDKKWQKVQNLKVEQTIFQSKDSRGNEVYFKFSVFSASGKPLHFDKIFVKETLPTLMKTCTVDTITDKLRVALLRVEVTSEKLHGLPNIEKNKGLDGEDPMKYWTINVLYDMRYSIPVNSKMTVLSNLCHKLHASKANLKKALEQHQYDFFPTNKKTFFCPSNSPSELTEMDTQLCKNLEIPVWFFEGHTEASDFSHLAAVQWHKYSIDPMNINEVSQKIFKWMLENTDEGAMVLCNNPDIYMNKVKPTTVSGAFDIQASDQASLQLFYQLVSRCDDTNFQDRMTSTMDSFGFNRILDLVQFEEVNNKLYVRKDVNSADAWFNQMETATKNHDDLKVILDQLKNVVNLFANKKDHASFWEECKGYNLHGDFMIVKTSASNQSAGFTRNAHYNLQFTPWKRSEKMEPSLVAGDDEQSQQKFKVKFKKGEKHTPAVLSVFNCIRGHGIRIYPKANNTLESFRVAGPVFVSAADPALSQFTNSTRNKGRYEESSHTQNKAIEDKNEDSQSTGVKEWQAKYIAQYYLQAIAIMFALHSAREDEKKLFEYGPLVMRAFKRECKRYGLLWPDNNNRCNSIFNEYKDSSGGSIRLRASGVVHASSTQLPNTSGNGTSGASGNGVVSFLMAVLDGVTYMFSQPCRRPDDTFSPEAQRIVDLQEREMLMEEQRLASQPHPQDSPGNLSDALGVFWKTTKGIARLIRINFQPWHKYIDVFPEIYYDREFSICWFSSSHGKPGSSTGDTTFRTTRIHDSAHRYSNGWLNELAAAIRATTDERYKQNNYVGNLPEVAELREKLNDWDVEDMHDGFVKYKAAEIDDILIKLNSKCIQWSSDRNKQVMDHHKQWIKLHVYLPRIFVDEKFHLWYWQPDMKTPVTGSQNISTDKAFVHKYCQACEDTIRNSHEKRVAIATILQTTEAEADVNTKLTSTLTTIFKDIKERRPYLTFSKMNPPAPGSP